MPMPCGHPPWPDCPPQPAANAHDNAIAVLAWYHSQSPEKKKIIDSGWIIPPPNGDDGPPALIDEQE